MVVVTGRLFFLLVSLLLSIDDFFWMSVKTSSVFIRSALKYLLYLLLSVFLPACIYKTNFGAFQCISACIQLQSTCIPYVTCACREGLVTAGA